MGLLEKVLFGESGITKRHFAMPDVGSLFTAAAETLNKGYEEHAPKLAGEALTKALEKAGLKADELDALFVCTCTGYLCPGVSSYVAEQIGLRQDAVLQDIVGLGCGAAVPTLRAASHFLSAHPDKRAAVIAVEICSAAFYIDNDPGVLISLCLFGDAASASIWGGDSAAGGLKLESFRSVHIPEEREKIRFVNAGGKLRNKLHRSVPALAAETVSRMFKEDRADAECDAMDFLSHTGGRDVIDALQEAIPGYDFADTTTVLDQCGNVSSPCVLLALERYLDRQNGGELAGELFLTGFGAGFSAHSCRALPA